MRSTSWRDDQFGGFVNAGVEYEWDAFYRLRKVKTQAGAPVAEYRYNGLGHRIGTLEDTDLDSDVDGSDLWYYSSYDERWRMVATYRGSDADPKERFVHHQAGASGDGGSSYIDLVAFRERDVDDGWTGDPDGTVDERLYYCQNQHADVVALITAAGAQRETARYSAYGVPFGLPVGDVNSDGACLQADQNQVRDWALATPAVYDVRGDLDLDGDVDLTDRDTLRDNCKGVTLGRGVLSAAEVRNQRGVAGYVAAGFEPSTCLIRHRVFPSELGVWASRDPLGYVDGASAYSAFVSAPPRWADASGRASQLPSGACSAEKPVVVGVPSVAGGVKYRLSINLWCFAVVNSAPAGSGPCADHCVWRCGGGNVSIELFNPNTGQWEHSQARVTLAGDEAYRQWHNSDPYLPPARRKFSTCGPEWSGPGTGNSLCKSEHHLQPFDIGPSDCGSVQRKKWTATTGGHTLTAFGVFSCRCH